MSFDARLPLSEDGSGLLFKLGRQPLTHLVNVPSTSPVAGATAEGCLLCNPSLCSPEFDEECGRYRVGVGASLFAQAATSAADAVSGACQRSALLSTGMPLLDDQLGGGLQTGEVCEIVGHSCSGKSQMCLAVCAHQLATSDFHVLYIDTSLSFTAERFSQMLRASFVASGSVPPAEIKHAVRKRLQERLKVCSAAQDLLGLISTLEALADELSSASDPSSWYRSLKLVVLDSAFAALVAENDGTSHSIAGAQVARLQHLLRQLAARWQLSLLVTNVTQGGAPVAGGSSTGGMALGYAWQHTAHTRIALLPPSRPASSQARPEAPATTTEELSLLCIHRRSHAARHSLAQQLPGGEGAAAARLALFICHRTHRLLVQFVQGGAG